MAYLLIGRTIDKEICHMKQLVWDTSKVFIIFISCTFLFYFSLRIIHAEYEQMHKYDSPEGPAIKVFNEEEHAIERLYLFFRLGE